VRIGLRFEPLVHMCIWWEEYIVKS
jgi:hypothetical protein